MEVTEIGYRSPVPGNTHLVGSPRNAVTPTEPEGLLIRAWLLSRRRRVGKKEDETSDLALFFLSFFSTGTYVYFALSRNTSYS